MAKALGIGGVFFKCEDPAALAEWYQKWLGLAISDFGGVNFELNKLPGNAFCVWGPFKASTDYFEPSRREFMVNLVVDDLEATLKQVEEGGAEVVGEIEEYEFGKFGWFIDPEGTKVELWQP